ncbi:MAG: radical SAM protein [Dehalococcoidia bacterium]
MISRELSFFEMGPIRPPSEGSDHSLLIRATRNCPWNKCAFCRTYRGKKFEYRSAEEVKGDIDAARAISDELKAVSWKMGLGGRMSGALIRAIMQNDPELYDQEIAGSEAVARVQSMINVANWIASGARTVFLQDANSLIMRTPDLLEVLTHLKETFPSIERITSYARSHTAARKSVEELKQLHRAGLSRLHIGMESGCDEVLEFIRKGVTAAEHIAAGQKVTEAGIELSEYVIPGLGGRRLSEKHAVDTAHVLNQINADFIRLRSLILREGTDLYRMYEAGEFDPPSEDEIIDELRLFIDHLDCSSYLVSDHMANLLQEIEGHLPQAKDSLLGIIDEYRSMPLEERLELQLKRRLRSHATIHGGIDKELEQSVQHAFDSIEKKAPEMEAETSAVLAILKQGSM